MEKIILEKYFENAEIKYYEPRVLVTILEDILGKDIETIKRELSELKIVVTAEQIKDYLNNIKDIIKFISKILLILLGTIIGVNLKK